MTFEDKSVKELLSLLEGVAPSVTAELRDRLTAIEEDIFNAGYVKGVEDGERNATVPDPNAFMRGEARGLVWASHAISGHKMEPVTNPFVSPTVVEKLLNAKKD